MRNLMRFLLLCSFILFGCETDVPSTNKGNNDQDVFIVLTNDLDHTVYLLVNGDYTTLEPQDSVSSEPPMTISFNGEDFTIDTNYLVSDL